MTDTTQRPATIAARRAAAEEYARWHLGSASWARNILQAFDEPEVMLRILAGDQGDYTDEAATLLTKHFGPAGCSVSGDETR